MSVIGDLHHDYRRAVELLGQRTAAVASATQPRRCWNRIPDEVRAQVEEVALEQPEQSARQLAWHITDTHDYFISESSVYRILRDYDLLPSPAYSVVSASDSFQTPTKRVNEMWQPAHLCAFYLSENHGLGLVLLVHDTGRFLTLHPRLAPVRYHGHR